MEIREPFIKNRDAAPVALVVHRLATLAALPKHETAYGRCAHRAVGLRYLLRRFLTHCYPGPNRYHRGCHQAPCTVRRMTMVPSGFLSPRTIVSGAGTT